MLHKKNITPQGYFEYTVFPLEGVWDLADEAKGLEKLDKEKLIYTIMIRQPDFVTYDIAHTVINSMKNKKPNQLYDKVKFESIEDGMCVQMMHVGSYDSEPISFSKMEEYCRANNLKRTSRSHREIYITYARKTPAEKLKTVQAKLSEKGIYADNLGSSQFLPWEVFIETVRLLHEKGGRAIRGNAINYRLGESGLPIDSVEGNIALKIYRKKLGESVFRRITPVACILIWAGICRHEPNLLILKEKWNKY
ncbi:hypothetical protein DXT63_07125 [Thermoanaerobacteraceae bacterium SP2]|nr:hypothetical protein DXT63_07125 [Thermoanaerobacteraceae bacterium SP2]